MFNWFKNKFVRQIERAQNNETKKMLDEAIRLEQKICTQLSKNLNEISNHIVYNIQNHSLAESMEYCSEDIFDVKIDELIRILKVRDVEIQKLLERNRLSLWVDRETFGSLRKIKFTFGKGAPNGYWICCSGYYLNN